MVTWLWDHNTEFARWQHPAMWHVVLGCNVIEFARWLHPAMWHVALALWHWIRQLAAPRNVACGSGMTCHWIHQLAAPCNVTRGSGMTCHWIRPAMLWDQNIKFAKRQHPAMWHVALEWHAIEFAKTSAIPEFYFRFRFRPYHRSRHVILHQSAKFYPN